MCLSLFLVKIDIVSVYIRLWYSPVRVKIYESNVPVDKFKNDFCVENFVVCGDVHVAMIK